MNNGYLLSRRWFDYAFEHRHAKVQHTALYLWLVELNNRLAWKSEFGVPTCATMEGLSIGNKQTYYSTLQDLQAWGFIKIRQLSKNQYGATVVSLCQFKSEPAVDTALDTALIQQSPSIVTSSVPIDKPINKETKKPRNGDLRFTPPEFKEVVSYMQELNEKANGRWPQAKIATESRGYFDYYTSNGWKVGKNSMKNWQASARNWMNNSYKYEKSNGSKQSISETLRGTETLATEALSILRGSNQKS